MTDEATPQPDAEVERKKALIAEGAARNPPVKLDMRYSEQRMRDALAKPDMAPVVPAAEAAPAVALAPDPRDIEIAALKAALAQQMEAKPAAPQPAPAPVNRAPANTLLMSTHDTLEAERNELLAQVNTLGIAMALPKNPSNETIRATIENHVANKAAAQAILDEQDRQAAEKGPLKMVKVRILPMGSGKLSRGVHIPSKGDSRFMYGETPDLEFSVAQENVARGYVEIVHA